jgi:putative transposase
LKRRWVEHDVRDEIVDFMKRWSFATELPTRLLLRRASLGASKFYNWKQRYGLANEHNASVPRDFWLENWEAKAILDFHARYPLEGYRRLTFMMLDRDIVAVSPATVYRTLRKAGSLQKPFQPSRKGSGFVQPLSAHEHWHIDISYINICGTFYYLCSVIDGASRYIVDWEIRPSMHEADVEVLLQRALEKFPGTQPRIISDNGPQFVAKDFKHFIRLAQLTHVRTSPHYPQSNGKIERWHGTLKRDCLRPKTPLSLDQAKQVVANFIEHYNSVRLHSAIGYVSPKDRLLNRHQEIFKTRDQKLEAAREKRRLKRQQTTAPDYLTLTPALSNSR